MKNVCRKYIIVFFGCDDTIIYIYIYIYIIKYMVIFLIYFKNTVKQNRKKRLAQNVERKRIYKYIISCKVLRSHGVRS